jgi:transcriptional regulator with XRE-family HTH domain
MKEVMAEQQASALGAHLKSLRTARGMSLADVAAQTEISGSYLFYLEAGKRLKPHPEYLHRLADFYGVLVEDLYSLAGYTPAGNLPELGVYLRTKYGMTPEDARTLQDYKDFLTERADDDNVPDQPSGHASQHRP